MPLDLTYVLEEITLAAVGRTVCRGWKWRQGHPAWGSLQVTGGLTQCSEMMDCGVTVEMEKSVAMRYILEAS